MRNRNLIQSFNNAINGIIFALKTEKNMKIHFWAAIIVLFFSLFTNLSRIEFLILVFTISLVIITEMVNTAVESLVDIATDNYHPLAKIAKDVAAGAVFISMLNAVVVAYIIFFEKLNLTTHWIITRVQQTPTHIMFIAVSMVLISVLALKAYFNKGTPFHGGMPSGHAALAFSTATAISFISKDMSVITLCLILAFLVAQSRVEGRIHNVFEVFFGVLIGVAVTVLIFLMLT